jgi:threonine aldolase
MPIIDDFRSDTVTRPSEAMRRDRQRDRRGGTVLQP